MKLITRDIINKNLKVKSFNDKDSLVKIDEYSYDDIIKGIDQAKTLLHNLGLRAGDKILLTTNNWPEYLVWFFSGAELGLSFLVSDYPDIDEKHLVERHLELYGEIKLHIGDKRSVVKDHLPSLKNKFFNYAHKDWK
jgi:non-ribosomal peptide synthetase component E (peptide arylation enzyme)